MKCFTTIVIIAAAIGVAIAGPEMKAAMMEIASQCADEYGITTDAFKKAIAGDMAGFDDQKKCSAKCFLEKIGVVDGSVKIIDAKLQNFIKDAPAELKAALLGCAKIDHAEPCEKSFQMVGCWMNQMGH